MVKMLKSVMEGLIIKVGPSALKPSLALEMDGFHCRAPSYVWLNHSTLQGIPQYARYEGARAALKTVHVSENAKNAQSL